MELYKELLLATLANESIHISVSGIPDDLHKLTSDHAVTALARIRAVLSNDFLNDPECFQKIEEIVTVFEQLGIGCGTRHDFG